MKNNLKKIRIEKGLSMQVLGENCGIAKGTIFELEKGAQPRIMTAYTISKVLDVGIYEIWPDCVEVIEETIVKRKAVIK